MPGTADVKDQDLLAAAHAVLLPAIGDIAITPAIESFLERGGVSLLLGETREEYVARAMSPERVAAESAATIGEVTAAVRSLAEGPALLAVDEEPGGIRRFAHLTGELAIDQGPEALESAALEVGRGLAELGVNVALGPVVDLEGGDTAWLSGRYLAADGATIAALGAAFIRGLQAAGVAATVKHFPGNRGLATDPMIDAVAAVPGGPAKLLADLLPFAAAVEAGTRCVMVGPGTVTALDRERPALLSATVIGVLRGLLGFDGVVISDDLDAAAVMAVGSVAATAVEALAVGNDLLLVSAENDLHALAAAIVAAVDDGALRPERLLDAAAKVRGLAAELDASVQPAG